MMARLIPVDELERVVRAAAAEAVARFGRVRAEQKRDGTIVTEADRAVQRAIVAALRALEPDPGRLAILAEEDRAEEDRAEEDRAEEDRAEEDRAEEERSEEDRAEEDGAEAGAAGAGAPPPFGDPRTAPVVAAIDPIDGTTAFASGLPFWTVSLGLLVGGRPAAGVIFAPLLGDGGGWLYRVGADGPATLNGAPLRVAPWTGWAPHSQLAVTSGAAALERLRGFGGKLRSLGSTAHHLAVTAAGLVDAAVIGRPWAWDVAAGAALVERAGGVLETFGGGPPDWTALLRRERQPEPLLVGSPAAVAALRAFAAR